MGRAGKLFFGRVEFHETEELREFQYRFLMVLLAFGALATALLLVTGSGPDAPIPEAHLRSMRLYTAAAFVLWLVLRGRKHLFLPVAWTFEVASLLEVFSSLFLVPGDELRILWCYTNVPGVYLLLGRLAGGIITALSIVVLVAGNAAMATPYSPNAIATAVVAYLYFGAFFHAYSRQLLYLFARLRHIAMHDPLTGVLNARAYYLTCDSLMRAARRGKADFAVLFVDLDHFKAINDTHGHAAGDTVLKGVATCLARQVRASDVLGRIGGEEFSIFLPATDVAGAMRRAELIRQAIEGLEHDIGTARLRITASIGVASGNADEASMQAIQAHADEAMYRAKAGGRNRVSQFATTA